MNTNLQVGELLMDLDFLNQCEDMKHNILGVQKVFDTILPLKEYYDKLSMASQIELDLLLAFMLNALQWINFQVKGIDPTDRLKEELLRIKTTVQRWEEVKNREKRPIVNIPVAKRIVSSGLYDHENTSSPDNSVPPNKKSRFQDM